MDRTGAPRIFLVVVDESPEMPVALYYAGAPNASPIFLAAEKLLAETQGGKDA